MKTQTKKGTATKDKPVRAPFVFDETMRRLMKVKPPPNGKYVKPKHRKAQA